MARFHDVHCTNCGNVYAANQMAVNIDRILQKNLAKMKNTNTFFKDAKELFDEIQIGMYQPRFQMAQTGILNGNRLKIDCRYILEFIQRKYQVEMDIEQLTGTSSQAEEAERYEDYFDEDYFDSLELNSDDGLVSMRNSDNTSHSTKIPESLLDQLCFKMLLYHKADTDETLKRKYVERLIQLLVENLDKVILECSCDFRFVKDDMENTFENMLTVTYLDRESESFQYMVCPNCGEAFYMDAGQYEERVVVMLGSSRVGKTAYLAALVDKLMPEFGHSQFANKITIVDSRDPKFTAFKKTILEAYRRNEKVVKTDKTKETVPLFSLKIKIEETGKCVIFTFVDLPGEVFVPRNDEEIKEWEADGKFIINHRKICGSADVFWFCIAPAQIDWRLRRRNESADSDRVEVDIDMVLSNIQTIVHLMSGMWKEVPPAAVFVTMSDIIAEEEKLFCATFNDGEYLKMPEGTKEVRFDQSHFASLAENVKKYLTSDNVKNIVSSIEDIFKNKNLFSVAAYGIDINKQANRDKQPYGILLPFMWTLAVFGYIKPVGYRVKNITALWSKHKKVEYYEEVSRQELFMD